MTHFFDNPLIEFLYFYSYSFIICALCMWATGLFLQRKIPLLPMALLNTLSYVTFTLLLEIAGIPLPWLISGPINYIAFAFFMFRGGNAEKWFAALMLYMSACMVDGLWAMFGVIFIEQYNSYLLNNILFYSAFHYLIMPGLSLSIFLFIKHFYAKDDFLKLEPRDKKYFLLTGVLTVIYTIFIASLAMAASQPDTSDSGVLLLNSVYGLSMGLFNFINIRRIYNKTIYLSDISREQTLLTQRHELDAIKDKQNREYKAAFTGITKNMANILNEALNYLEINERETAFNLIQNSAADLKSLKRSVKTGNRIVDYFLYKTEEAAKIHNIKLTYECYSVKNIKIDEIDLCTIISNIFDNAVNACKNVTGSRYINVNIHKNGNVLFIDCENPKPNTSPLIIRKGIHGYGLINIKDTVSKYGGDVQIADTAHTYKIEVLLYVGAAYEGIYES